MVGACVVVVVGAFVVVVGAFVVGVVVGLTIPGDVVVGVNTLPVVVVVVAMLTGVVEPPPDVGVVDGGGVVITVVGGRPNNCDTSAGTVVSDVAETLAADLDGDPTVAMFPLRKWGKNEVICATLALPSASVDADVCGTE